MRKFTLFALALMTMSSATPAESQAGLKDFHSLQVRTGALYLHRSDNNDDTLIINGNAEQQLNSSDLDPGSDTGYELGLIGNFDCKNAIELRYFHLDGFHNSAILNDPTGVGFNTEPEGLGLFNATANGTIDYTSELTNVEVNGRRHLNCDLDFIYGVRHIRQEEELDGFYSAPDFPDTTNTVDFDANNYLTGFQAGLDSTFFRRGCFSLEGLAKAGIYHNQVQTSYTALGTGQLNTTDEFAVARKDLVSFVGEAQLAGVYQVNKNISLRAAYQFLIMTNIATAPNQVVGTDRSGPSTTAVASESPIYQGIALQAEFWLWK